MKDILPKPFCALCKKPVDKITVSSGVGMDVSVVVECHGHHEEHKLSKFSLMSGEVLIDEVFKNFTVSPKK